ncbi:hypothetical protein BAE44_0023036 [Dichanthelium oligosanthes]|uniref:Uncharacterized protein n=1 Tax=Dichanthelium oligosanthes TaxID=888268 RepID=A0A1E5UST5_9POAL|nr:hypothetical protein BAE44_0023036 [Dichanthelium oligosanthes]
MCFELLRSNRTGEWSGPFTELLRTSANIHSKEDALAVVSVIIDRTLDQLLGASFDSDVDDMRPMSCDVRPLSWDLGGRAGKGECLFGRGGEKGSLVPSDEGGAGDWGGIEGAPGRHGGEEGSLMPGNGGGARDWGGIKGPGRRGEEEEGDSSS